MIGNVVQYVHNIWNISRVVPNLEAHFCMVIPHFYPGLGTMKGLFKKPGSVQMYKLSKIHKNCYI